MARQAIKHITQQQLQELLSYDQETGAFVWLARTSNRTDVGREAGNVTPDGYVRIGVLGQVCKAQRLAWLYVTGSWPTGVIDHKDGDRLNNRFANLRDVSLTTNNQNMRRVPSHNRSTGVLGVTRVRNKAKPFVAQISVNNRNKVLGAFATVDEAHSCYLAAKRRLHEGCTL